jgi:hypothetical protein
MSIKKFFLAAAAAVMFSGCAMMPAGSGASAQPEVAAAAERLRIAMIDPTAAALGALVADEVLATDMVEGEVPEPSGGSPELGLTFSVARIG